MTKDELVSYVLNSPENTNPNVFRSLLDVYVSENGGGSSGDGDELWTNAAVTLINSNPESAFLFYNPFSEFTEEILTEIIINLPVPKNGTLYLDIYSFGNFDNSIEPICTGDIIFEERFEITGDGTITLAAAADGTTPK